MIQRLSASTRSLRSRRNFNAHCHLRDTDWCTKKEYKDSADLADAKIIFSEIMEKLPQESRILLDLYYNKDMSQKEIAEKLNLSQMAVSRRREFLADSTAVEFTRNPEGLISALQKLEDDPNQLETANSATANMYIVNPFKKNTKEGKKKSTSIWSTHPSTADRIEALRNLK